jgi:putative heme iron utilization protein
MISATESVPFFPAAHRDRIVGHMNEDHADAVLHYVRHFGGLAAATAARLDDLDREGMAITANLPSGPLRVRIAYPKPLDTPADAHHVLVEMAVAAAKADPSASSARKDDALARARETAARLRSNLKTVILGTVSTDGLPDASVAPAVLGADGAFHIYVSGLSFHTRNLAETGKASVFVIQDESEAKQLLARQRITFPCSATVVARDTPEFSTSMADLKQKFGPVMEHLEGMADFRMFRLAPARGRLVAGFGQAYDVDPLDWTKLSHVNDTGHTPAHGHGPHKA